MPGRAGRLFPQWLGQACTTLATIDINSSKSIAALENSFLDYEKSESLRLDRIEQRVLELERQSTNLEEVKNTVIDFINRRLKSALLPEDINQFIRAQLVSDLQYLLINEGVNSPIWTKWQRLIQILSWAFIQDATPSYKAKVEALIVPMAEQLSDEFFCHFPDATPYPKFSKTCKTILST